MNKYLLLLLLYLPIFSGIYYLNQLTGILEFILGLIMYLSVFYFFHVVWTYYRKKETLIIVEYAKKFYISLGTVIFISIGILGSFGYYQLIYKPLTIEQITISNGDKTIVFQKMIHIAKPNYYESIAQEIENYKNTGYVYFFEGVKGGTEENMNNFNNALGIEFDADLYGNLSKLYDLIPQDNSIFINIVNNKDYNIDMNIDEIIKEYEKLKQEQNIIKQYSPPINVTKEIINSLSQVNDRQLKVLQLINLTFLTTLTKNESILESIQSKFGNEQLFQVILEGRNKVIVDSIIKSDDKNIFATYGALHFKGVLAGLQEQDKNWKIISEKKFYPFQGGTILLKK